jgi:hypothetical protein
MKFTRIQFSSAPCRVIRRTTKTGERDFGDISRPFAGLERSQMTTAEDHNRAKPRKFRGKFEFLLG